MHHLQNSRTLYHISGTCLTFQVSRTPVCDVLLLSSIRIQVDTFHCSQCAFLKQLRKENVIGLDTHSEEEMEALLSKYCTSGHCMAATKE